MRREEGYYGLRHPSLQSLPLSDPRTKFLQDTGSMKWIALAAESTPEKQNPRIQLAEGSKMEISVDTGRSPQRSRRPPRWKPNARAVTGSGSTREVRPDNVPD